MLLVGWLFWFCTMFCFVFGVLCTTRTIPPVALTSVAHLRRSPLGRVAPYRLVLILNRFGLNDLKNLLGRLLQTQTSHISIVVACGLPIERPMSSERKQGGDSLDEKAGRLLAFASSPSRRQLCLLASHNKTNNIVTVPLLALRFSSVQVARQNSELAITPLPFSLLLPFFRVRAFQALSPACLAFVVVYFEFALPIKEKGVCATAAAAAAADRCRRRH